MVGEAQHFSTSKPGSLPPCLTPQPFYLSAVTGPGLYGQLRAVPSATMWHPGHHDSICWSVEGEMAPTGLRPPRYRGACPHQPPQNHAAQRSGTLGQGHHSLAHEWCHCWWHVGHGLGSPRRRAQRWDGMRQMTPRG